MSGIPLWKRRLYLYDIREKLHADDPDANATLSLSEKLQPLENERDLLNSGGHKLIQSHGPRWLIPSYPSYLDQYLSGAAEMHIHFRRSASPIRETGGEGISDFCIVLRKLPIGHGCKLGQNLTSDGDSRCDVGHSGTRDCESTMFVSVVETADESERMAMPLITSMKGLYVCDDCSSFRMQTMNSGLEISSSVGIIDHELTVLVFGEDVGEEDWEARTLATLRGDTGHNDIIECTTEVVYKVPQHDSNHGVRLFGN